MITREQWINRLATCKEEDLEYLTTLFHDWRQDALGEYPDCLQFEVTDYHLCTWYNKGPSLVKHQPIRKLDLSAHLWKAYSAEVEGYCYVYPKILHDDFDRPLAEKLVRLWFPEPHIIYEPDSEYKILKYYRRADTTLDAVIGATGETALLWAREKAKAR